MPPEYVFEIYRFQFPENLDIPELRHYYIFEHIDGDIINPENNKKYIICNSINGLKPTKTNLSNINPFENCTHLSSCKIPDIYYIFKRYKYKYIDNGAVLLECIKINSLNIDE